MTAFIVWIKSQKPKCSIQVWRFNSDKALRKPDNVVMKKQITDEEADTLTLKQLEEIHGSIYQSDTVVRAE